MVAYVLLIEELITAIKNDIKYAEMKLSDISMSPDQLHFFGKATG